MGRLSSIASLLITLYHISTTITNAQISLSPDSYEYRTIVTSASNKISKSALDIDIPDYLLNATNFTAPVPLIIGYYNEKLHIIDAVSDRTYYTRTDSSQDWTEATTNEVPQTGGCFTGKCFTQIDAKIYIMLDGQNTLYVYNMEQDQFESSISLELDDTNDAFCLSSNDSHIFMVGWAASPNIIIVEPDTEEINYSEDYIATGRQLACGINTNTEGLSILSGVGSFEYLYNVDYVSTIYDRDYEMPFNNFTNLPILSIFTALLQQTPSPNIASTPDFSLYPQFSATDADSENGVMWIRGYEGHIYPYSTITQRFLPCRVQEVDEDIYDRTLFFVDNYLFDFGGFNPNKYPNNMVTNRIELIDTSFIDDRFTLNDWYYPDQPLGVNYSYNALEMDVEDWTYVYLGLSSLDFNVEGFEITLSQSILLSATELCQICYSNCALAGSSVTGLCRTDGLIIELLDSDVTTINDDDTSDITTTLYSIEISPIGYEPYSGFSGDFDSSNPQFICNSFPIYPVYLTMNFTLYSDEYFFLVLNYEYVCSGCSVTDFNDGDLYPFESTVTFTSPALGLDDDITITIKNQDTCTIVDDNDVQYSCDNFTLSHITETYFEGAYLISLSSSDTYLESSAVLLSLSDKITGCREGSGYNGDTHSCSLCLDGSFNLRNDLSSCISCEGLDGVTCDGANIITVAHRYWVSGYRQSTDEYITLFEVGNGTTTGDDVLISHICGYGQCCEEIDGCDYVTYFDDDALCSNNRDLTTAMCTGCEAETYELLSTNDCGDCDYYDNMWYLLGIFCIAFVLTFYLAFCDAKPLDIMIDKVKNRHRKDSDDCDDDNDEEESSSYEDDRDSSSDHDDEDEYGGRQIRRNKPKRKKKKKRKTAAQVQAEESAETQITFSYFVADSYIANSALIFQIFVYYFQGYAEILSSSGSRAYLSPIINFFNFNFANDQVGSNGDADSNAGFCAIPFATALSEIMMTLIFPGMMLFSLLLIYSFCNRGCGGSYYTKPYVPITFYRIWIVIIGFIFRVLMQLITCTVFVNEESWTDEKWEQFYYNQPCFGTAWFLALAGFILLFIFFIQIYIKLYNQTPECRYALDNKYTKLVQAYKTKYWYWEAVTTTRRFIITMFVTLSFIGGGYSNLILCLILIFYLIAHLTVYPWKHKRNNRIETFCILSLLIGFIGINFDDIANSLFLSLFLGIVIFMPVVIALYYLFKLCTNCYRYYEGNDQYFIDYRSKSTYEEKVKNMKMRVLQKRQSAYLSNNIDLQTTKPDGYTDDGSGTSKKAGYGDIEMPTFQKQPTKDGNHSDSSCGLSE